LFGRGTAGRTAEWLERVMGGAIKEPWEWSKSAAMGQGSKERRWSSAGSDFIHSQSQLAGLSATKMVPAQRLAAA
jgi:hypothetical protein